MNLFVITIFIKQQKHSTFRNVGKKIISQIKLQKGN